MNAPKNTCYESGPNCEGDLNERSIVGWTWNEATGEDGDRCVERVMLCGTHELGMAATEGEVERWLAGREDWRQPVSKTDCGAPTTPTCYWPGECSSHDGQAISAVVTA